MVPRCGWCRARDVELPDGDRLVLVGIHEGGSGPGAAVRACQPCVIWYGLVPAAEQPDDWLGEVRYRPRADR
jgi:hypothetical protein